MWEYYNYISYTVLSLWVISSLLIYAKGNAIQNLGLAFHFIATLIVGSFILGLWITLERPPMRTLSETRIWYSFFMGLIGFVLYFMYRHKWILNYSALMGIVFVLITFLRPDTQNKTLMPALQSVWFVPHVIVYIFAYAMLGMATVTAVYGIYLYRLNKELSKVSFVTDQLIRVGYVFLTFGLLFGALWAKEAWGHYWTWDPKETWAFITWISYLVYIHYKYVNKDKNPFRNFILVVIAFLMLLVCWFGVNYLPTASMSVHTYYG